MLRQRGCRTHSVIHAQSLLEGGCQSTEKLMLAVLPALSYGLSLGYLVRGRMKM
jgi:hypothetical protein